MLRDDQWQLLEALIATRNTPGTKGNNNRLYIEAVFWIVANRRSWRDLPAKFGSWQPVYVRYKRWVLSGMWRYLARGVMSDYTLHLVLKEIVDYGEEYLQRKQQRDEYAAEKNKSQHM
jgi:transposase